jgi:hypothetical protein
MRRSFAIAFALRWWERCGTEEKLLGVWHAYGDEVSPS